MHNDLPSLPHGRPQGVHVWQNITAVDLVPCKTLSAVRAAGATAAGAIAAGTPLCTAAGAIDPALSTASSTTASRYVAGWHGVGN